MKVNLYFVFYVALILELLIFIIDRDEAMEANDRLINSLVDEILKSPIKLSPQTDWKVGYGLQKLTIPVSGLITEIEKQNITYKILNVGNSPLQNFAVLGPTPDGNGQFSGNFEVNKTYEFEASCSVTRDVSKFSPEVRKAIEELGPISAKSDPVRFTIHVSDIVIPPLEMRVEGVTKGRIPASELSALAGVPFQRGVFVNVSDKTTITSPIVGSVQKTNGAFEFTWNNPINTTTVTLRGNANRDLPPNMDQDALSFTIKVTPGDWDSNPCNGIFKLVKKTFTSKMTTLNLGTDYMIRMIVTKSDGTTLPDQNIYARFDFTPDKDWAKVTFTPILLNQARTPIQNLKRECDVLPCPRPEIVFSAGQPGTKNQSGLLTFLFAVKDLTGQPLHVGASVTTPTGLSADANPMSDGRGFYLIINNSSNYSGNASVTITATNGCQSTESNQTIRLH